MSKKQHIDLGYNPLDNRIYLSDGTDVTDKALAFVFDHLVKVHDGWLPMRQPNSGKVLIMMVSDTTQQNAASIAYKKEGN
jgi:hypothetical protein